MANVKIVKNTTVSNVLVAQTGVNVLASSSYTIPTTEYSWWIGAIDSQLTAGTLVANDGIGDLNATRGIALINGTPAKYVSFDNSTNGFASTDTQAAIEESRAALSIPTLDQNLYVTKQGNDTTGNGSLGLPYLTIGKALSIITDSSPTKRYDIQVGPGDYNENLVLKANVFVQGSGPIATRLTGTTLNINDATWNVAGADNRSGFQDISVYPTCTFDFSAQAGNDSGKLFFYNVRTSGGWTLTALNAINQVIVRDTDFFGNWTQAGINTFISNSTWQSGNIVVNSSSTNGIPAIFTVVSGRITGNITGTWTANSPVTLNLAGLIVGASTILTGSGAQCTVNANDGSLPLPANRSFVSSAILNRVNDNFAAGLLSATTNVSVYTATAPVSGQALIATGPSAATWQYVSSILTDFGDGSDGALSASSGTITLVRDTYYSSITLSGTAVLNTNGWKIFCQGACTLSGTSTIHNDGNVGTAASGGTVGTGGAITQGMSMGAGQPGGNGGAFGNNGAGSAGTSIGAVLSYGGASQAAGKGGNSGSNLATGGSGGTVGALTLLPERTVRQDHLINMAYKLGGQGGPGGGGGSSSLLSTAGSGGGGGSGGGVIILFCGSLNNTSSIGITVKGGNGGAGGNATGGNSGGGGGGSGGGGGNIYIVTLAIVALGTLNVAGGTAGAAGALAGSGFVGIAGAAGLSGHTSVFSYGTNSWTVT